MKQINQMIHFSESCSLYKSYDLNEKTIPPMIRERPLRYFNYKSSPMK